MPDFRYRCYFLFQIPSPIARRGVAACQDARIKKANENNPSENFLQHGTSILDSTTQWTLWTRTLITRYLYSYFYNLQSFHKLHFCVMEQLKPENIDICTIENHSF